MTVESVEAGHVARLGLADELLSSLTALQRQRGNTYAHDDVSTLAYKTADGIRSLEAVAVNLQMLDRDNASTIARLQRELSAERARRIEAEQGAADPNALQRNRAERLAETQADAERLLASAQERATGVVRAARQRAQAILGDAEQRAADVSERDASGVPRAPEATGVVRADLKNEAIWLGRLKTFIGQRTDALRQKIREEMAGLADAEAALDAEETA